MKDGATLAKSDGGSGPFSRATEIELSCVSRARDRVVGISNAATAICQLVSLRSLLDIEGKDAYLQHRGTL